MTLPGDLAAWGSRRVLVVGDVMLDRFVYGEVQRISPEAPIPVLRKSGERAMLGGAGNVARNVVAMGGRVRLVGRRGRDAAGEQIAALATSEGIEDAVNAWSGPTTQKVRYVAQGQQLLRLDDEATDADEAEAQAIIDVAGAALPQAHVLILSDYGKGVLTDTVLASLIARARALGVPVVVDPKRVKLDAYAGATLLTPNAAEARLATGIDPACDASAEAAGRRVMELACADAALITRGPRGMTLVDASGAHHLRASAREVFDVSGAGDTVVAALALTLGARRSLVEGARLANAAAGLVVARSGTATVDRAAIADALRTRPQMEGQVIADRAGALAAAERWRSRGFRIGFTNGCFDLLHAGHVRLLAQAKDACDRLIVGLNSDASVHRLKGPGRPIQPQDDRAALLAAMASVDLVVVFDEDTPQALITTLRPDVLVKGADYAGHYVVGRDEIERGGGSVILATLVPGRSTTALAQQIAGPHRPGLPAPDGRTGSQREPAGLMGMADDAP